MQVWQLQQPMMMVAANFFKVYSVIGVVSCRHSFRLRKMPIEILSWSKLGAAAPQECWPTVKFSPTAAFLVVSELVVEETLVVTSFSGITQRGPMKNCRA